MVRIGGKGMSYIVKNCPCIKHYDDIELDNRCMSNEHIPFFCENNPDCVIKQVIDKCKYYQNKIGRTLQYRAGFVDATKDILQLFDIEEINK